MNILNEVIKSSSGYYCHALEVSSVYELECAVESLVSEFASEYSELEILEFFECMSIYCLEDSEEDAVYDVDVAELVKEMLS